MEVVKVQQRDLEQKAKKLRRVGFVPGSIFGGTLSESVSIQMEEAAAKKIVREKREGSKLRLDLNGKLIPVQIKEKSVDILTNEIIHLNFQALKAGQKVNSVIHILLENADAVPGNLEKLRMEIPYASLPEDMIDTLSLNLADLPAGTVICAADVPELMSDRIELQMPTDEMILRINDRKRAE